MGRRMGDRQDIDDLAALIVSDRHDDGAGAVLDALLPAGGVLAPPQVGIANDEAGPRVRPAHGARSSSSASRCANSGETSARAMASNTWSGRSADWNT